MLQTAGRVTSPNLASCCYTILLTFGLLVAFRPCSLRVQPVPRPTLDNKFMPISPSTQTLPKKLRGRLSPRPICFCNPKSFLDPQRLAVRLPYSLGGLIRLILYHGGVGCGSGLYDCFDLSHGPPVRVLTHFVLEREKGRGSEGFVCVCIALVLVYNWRRPVPVFPILLHILEQLYLYTELGGPLVHIIDQKRYQEKFMGRPE